MTSAKYQVSPGQYMPRQFCLYGDGSTSTISEITDPTTNCNITPSKTQTIQTSTYILSNTYYDRIESEHDDD
jgi:hypothetical protein